LFTGEKISNEQLTQDDVLSSKTDDNHIETIDERYLQEERTTDEEEDAENLSVYIARYSYDPYQHSPNECPDAELAFQAGDYLYVFGDFDDVSIKNIKNNDTIVLMHSIV
jgi:hypothetical protein